MRKNIFKKIFLAALVVFFVSAGVLLAQNDLFFGQQHFYSVVFRGNGEAIVYAKLVMTNSEDQALSEISFEIPKVTPSDIVVFQQKLSPRCAQYDYQNPSRPCLEYSEPDYGQNYYYYGGDSKAEYRKVPFTKSGGLYRLSLPYPVEPSKSTAVIVAYAAKGYVKESAGLFKFNFETLKVPSRVQQIRVAVDVDSELYLKGKRSEVNYGTDLMMAPASLDSQSIANPALDKLAGRIGSYGAITKEAKSLAPNESFIVSGEYAKSWFRLYLLSILITVLIIAGIIALVYLLSKYLRKKIETTARPNDPLAVMPMNQPSAAQSNNNVVSLLVLPNVIISFLSVAAVVGLSFALSKLPDAIFLRGFDPGPLFAIVAIIAVVLLYILIIFGPPIVMAIKHGWKALVSILIAEFLWLLVFFIIYLALFATGLTSSF